MEACRNTTRTPAELAALLERSLVTVKNKYLPPLVESGQLEALYLNSPTHPQQAYRTKKEPA